MRLIQLLILALCAASLTMATQEKPDPSYLTNGNFQQGLTGWKRTGQVRVHARTGGIELGSGRGAVTQEYQISGLRIVWFGANFHAAGATTKSRVRARCYDGHRHLLMDIQQAADAKKALDPSGAEAAIYFKTHALTRRLVLSLEREDAGPGLVTVTSAALHDYDRDRKDHASAIALDAYMHPIWSGSTVTDETVLLLSEHGSAATGNLLFTPDRILAVRDSALKREFAEGRDYTVDGKTIGAVSGSDIPTMHDSDFPTATFPWISLAGKHVKVTYEHSGNWLGPTVKYQGESLPITMGKLTNRKPLKIVALGDSITLGMNVSGYLGEPPYMPCWADLFVGKLRALYGNSLVKMYNAGLGGMTASWGQATAAGTISHLSPDLVLVGFGMNDFWSETPEEFRSYISGILAAVRSQQPRAEFILISSLKFDPAYTADPTYVGHLVAYSNELKSLVGPGVAMVDMTAISDALYRAKKPKDLMADPMHPDDFLARWYAQSLVALLDNGGRALSMRPKAASLRGRTFYVDNGGDDSSEGSSLKRAWSSLARVSRAHLGAGDSVVLTGGQTFKGSLVLAPDVAGTPERPIVVRSSGPRATIISLDGPAIAAHCGGFEVRNLNLIGGAPKSKAGHDGISLSAVGAERQHHVRIQNVDISGFGGNGIDISAGKNSSNGFDDVVISKVRAHDNFSSGIETGDDVAWRGLGYAHRNITIIDCEVSRNQSGSGIVLSGVDGALVEFCHSSENVGKGGGVGLWAWSARHVVFRYCVANATHTGGGDGGGFDLDGGCVECVVERCLSFDNFGPGYMHCDYPGAPSTHSNFIRDSISLDDGRKEAGDNVGAGFVTWGSGLDNCVVERNLVRLTKADPAHRESGLLFVTYIEGSQTGKDVLHVRGCIFRNNVVEMGAIGSAFVRNGTPKPTASDVLFEGDKYLPLDRGPFIEGKQGEHRYPTLDEWRSASGQEKQSGSKSHAISVRQRLDLRLLAPRDLPRLFSNRSTR